MSVTKQIQILSNDFPQVVVMSSAKMIFIWWMSMSHHCHVKCNLKSAELQEWMQCVVCRYASWRESIRLVFGAVQPNAFTEFHSETLISFITPSACSLPCYSNLLYEGDDIPSNWLLQGKWVCLGYTKLSLQPIVRPSVTGKTPGTRSAISVGKVHVNLSNACPGWGHFQQSDTKSQLNKDKVSC